MAVRRAQWAAQVVRRVPAQVAAAAQAAVRVQQQRHWGEAWTSASTIVFCAASEPKSSFTCGKPITPLVSAMRLAIPTRKRIFTIRRTCDW